MKTRLELVRIFNATSSFNKFWNKKVLSTEPKFKDLYSSNNLPQIKHEAYLINLDEFKPIGTHWITLYVNVNDMIYFDSFGAEYFPKEMKKLIGKKIS